MVIDIAIPQYKQLIINILFQYHNINSYHLRAYPR